MAVGVAVCGFGSAVSLLFAGTNSEGLAVNVVAFTRSAATKTGGPVAGDAIEVALGGSDSHGHVADQDAAEGCWCVCRTGIFFFV